MRISLLVVLLFSILGNCEGTSNHAESVQTKNFEYLRRIYRDNVNNPQYTQGFVFLDDETLLESAGLWRKSSIHYFKLDDVDNFIYNTKLSSEFFGEGCDVINDKVYQLTYQDRKIFVYEKEDLSFVGEIPLPSKINDGWGLTHRVVDGNIEIIITDGSNRIYILDETFNIIRWVPIWDNYRRVTQLNELEYVDGLLYVNVYQQPYILAIDIDKRKVVQKYDFSDLVEEADRNSDECLNGIAYNNKTGTFWITGKFWPFIQEVKLK